ncbi:MAG: DMT family transporter, partial [Bacteroidota bacterium]
MKNAEFIHVHEARATTFMLLSSACWGMGTVMSKGVLGQIPPFTLLAIQLGSSVTFLGIVTLLKHPWKVQLLSVKHFLSWQMFRFSLPGLLEPGIAYTLGHVGLVMTTAANTLLINALEPVITMSLAWLLLGEKIEILMLLTSLIAIAGILISLGFDPRLSSGMFLGDLLVLIGTASASLYVVLSYHGVKRVEPLTLALMQQSFGLFWIVFIWLILERGEWYALSDVDLLTWL